MESSAIEIMLDQPRRPKPASSYNKSEQDLPEIKTQSTVSSTDSPHSSSAGAGASQHHHQQQQQQQQQQTDKRKSFRDRFMRSKHIKAVNDTPVPDKRAKTTKTFRNQPVPEQSVSSTTLESTTSAPPSPPEQHQQQQRQRPRSKSVSKRALISRNSPPSSPDKHDTQRRQSLAGEDVISAPLGDRKSIHHKAKALMKRTVCGPKAVDEEYEASLNVFDQRTNRPLPQLYPWSPTVGMDTIPSPVSTPASRQLMYGSGGASATSPTSPTLSASSPHEIPASVHPPRSHQSSQGVVRYVRPVIPASDAHPRSHHSDRGAAAAVVSPTTPLLSSLSPLSSPAHPPSRGKGLGDRKPSSIEMNRYASHVSELSLPVLKQQLQQQQQQQNKLSLSSSQSHKSSLAEESVAAVRNIMSQVEDELQQGIPRQDILAQLQSLAATLEEQLEQEQLQRRLLKRDRTAEQRGGSAANKHAPRRTTDDAGVPPQPSDDRSGRKQEYVETVLKDPQMTDVPFESDDDTDDDDDDSDDDDDETSATGTYQERGFDDDHSEFTKWMEEIENEEGGVAKESLNFLLGLFNFSSLMVPRIEEDEYGADHSCASSTTGGSLSLFPPLDPNGPPTPYWTTSSDAQPRGEMTTTDDSFGATHDAWWVDDEPTETVDGAPASKANPSSSSATLSQPRNVRGSPPPQSSPPSDNDDDGGDDTLSLSSIESHQYSKEESLRPVSRGRKFHRPLDRPKVGTTAPVPTTTTTATGEQPGGGGGDYDQLWGSLRGKSTNSRRRPRSRSLRGPFRSLSRGSTKEGRQHRRGTSRGGGGRSSAGVPPDP